MAKKVTVTRAQKTAAEYALARSSRAGRSVPRAVARIARATSSGPLNTAGAGG